MSNEEHKNEMEEKIALLEKEKEKLLRELKICKESIPPKIESRGKFSNRKTVKEILEDGPAGVQSDVLIAGWARSIRKLKTCAFIEFNDGSIHHNLQIVIDEVCEGYQDVISLDSGIGASFVIKGEIVARKVVERKGSQPVEMKAHHVELHGKCTTGEYPISRTPKEGNKIPMEKMREMQHLRGRTNVMYAMIRVRNACQLATHNFFQSNNFVHIHTPVITTYNAEGSGEMFQVTTLLRKKDKEAKEIAMSSYVPPVPTQPQNQNRPDRGTDYFQDYFGKKTFLTTSGQINGEMYAAALGNVYSFGPTFRAEISQTNRHAAEFWMVEPEMAFADLEEAMDTAEIYIKYVIRYVLSHCVDELGMLDHDIEKGIVERLEQVESSPFKRITYTEAIDILQKSKKKFKDPAEWGEELQMEHEKYLSEVAFKQPVFVYNFPRETKPFYTRLNEDEKTVASMDLLFPKIGEMVGGSQREERLKELEERIQEFELDPKMYEHYLDLRRYGSFVHSGFGLGFDRLVMFMTGIENIRDVIPFPRVNKNADF